MRRICCFCETWASGGIESFLNNVLNHMGHANLQVDVVAAHMDESVFTAEMKANGIRFIELSGKLHSAENYSLFRRVLKENQYDVVHFNLYQGLALYYVRIAKEEKVPVRIAHSHNTELRKSLFRPVKLFLHGMGCLLFADAATDYWACSKAAGDFLFPKKTVRFIPNGIETERFRYDGTVRTAVRTELGLGDDFVIGSVGRLCDQKNQAFLLDVFAEVVKAKPKSRLLLVGEGELRAQLEEKAGELGISNRVIFYGVTDRVERLYCAMDVFAFPSLFEGLGIVAVEAQAAGLPVVMSEHVPPEAAVTEMACYRHLSDGTTQWAQSLLRCGDLLTAEREKGCDEVQSAGFDVADVAAELSDLFQQEEIT